MFMNLHANGAKPITHLYSASEIALYNHVQGAIASGNAVIASTDSYLKGASSHSGYFPAQNWEGFD
jgi:hypothetical protein